MKIAISVAHTLKGAGTGANGLLNESKESRIICPLVVKYLRDQGHEVDLLQVDERITYNGKLEADFVTRARQANSKKYNLLVEIHLNDATPTGHGTEVYYTSDNGKLYADKIVKSIAELGFRNRGSKLSNTLYILNATKATAILVECCFVNSTEDYGIYNAEKVAKAIVKGITGQAVLTQNIKPIEGEFKKMNNINYFFHEWLIINKKMTIDQYNVLTETQFKDLQNEFLKVWSKTK